MYLMSDPTFCFFGRFSHFFFQTHANTMAALTGQQEQEWEPVVFHKNGARGPTTSKTDHMNAQKRAGRMRAQLKMGKTNNAAVSMSGRVGVEQNMCKLEEGGEETFRHAKVNNELRSAISRARTAKGLTQKQLAGMLNVRVSMIADYEAGKAIPNPQFIVRLERKLNSKLPRGQRRRGVAAVAAPAASGAKKPKPKKKRGPVVVDILKGLRISK